MRFQSNRDEAVTAFEAWFGAWRHLRDAAELVAAKGVRVRVIVHQGEERVPPPVPMAYRMPDGDRVFVHTGGSFGVADVQRGDGVAYVTEQLLADRAHFQYGVLEMLTLVLVTTLDRCPVHAAAVVRRGTALLLAGPTGSGKSTLALSAVRLGCDVLSDDAVYVQVRPDYRIWGMPGPVHLAPEAMRHFPELGGRPAVKLANGKTKVPLEGRAGSRMGVLTNPSRAGVCLLRPSNGDAALTPVTQEELQTALMEDLRGQADLYANMLPPALHRLCAGGGWRLNLSDDPRDALPYIERMLAELEAQA